MAGIRTNALVAGGSALFVVMGAYSFGGIGADPTRVAAQIMSGIGFLGAGVIMREGLNVRGLNTAATLWCAAAVGSLAGSGLYLQEATTDGEGVRAELSASTEADIGALERTVKRLSLDPKIFAVRWRAEDSEEG